jgi:hypothetical protein
MPRTAADKFKEDLDKRVKWWTAEFELDHWAIAGVLADVLIDTLFGYNADDDDDDDDDDDEDE